MKRRAILAGAIVAMAASLPTASMAEWPERPIRMIVPFGPGGGADTLGRTVAEPLGELLGVEIIAENVTGAGGTIGVGTMANSEADDYTIGVIKRVDQRGRTRGPGQPDLRTHRPRSNTSPCWAVRRPSSRSTPMSASTRSTNSWRPRAKRVAADGLAARPGRSRCPISCRPSSSPISGSTSSTSPTRAPRQRSSTRSRVISRSPGRPFPPHGRSLTKARSCRSRSRPLSAWRPIRTCRHSPSLAIPT